MRRNPALTIGTLTTLVAAVLGLLAAYNLNVSDQQESAILAVLVAAAPIVSAILTRARVTPNASVAALVQHGTNALGGDATRVVAGPASPVPNGAEVHVEQV